MRTWLLAALLFCELAHAGQLIQGADSRLHFRGAQYITHEKFGVQFQRHREDVLALPRKELGLNPDNARNTAGVVLDFRSDSAWLAARFTILSANYMGSVFAVFENGKLIGEFPFTPKTKGATVGWQSTVDGESRFEVVLPSYANAVFTDLEIDDGARLLKPPGNKGVYVALGDSISHGVGQGGASHTTWPYLLSRKLDHELFNLAVGGGKVSVPVGQMLEDWEQIDLITILVGYNDLHFNHKSPDTYQQDYARLLDAIRKHHPDTRILCITPLYTKKPKAEKTGHTIQEYRGVLEALVAERRSEGDKQLFVVQGETISSERNLRSERPEDPVHLGVEGASMLADEVFTILEGLK